MKKCFVVIYCTLIAISCNSKMFEDISLYSGQEIPQNTNLTQGIVTDIYIITYDAPRNLYISKNMGLLFNKIDFGPNMSLEYFAVNNRGELLTVEYDNVSGKRYIRISFPQGGKTNCFNGELNITDSVAAVSESDEGDFFLCVQKAGTKKLLRRPLGTIDLYEMSDYTGTITYN
ncbi:MAG: hypothetical protein N2316_10110, partial [Spirochaetes bacterium]|nr:hypothetical protein [Spirochaetota bacterium]